jgi:hypothetical protein
MLVLMAQMESLANPPARGGDQADLFAGTPFKTTGWAGQEKHRQYQQRSGKKREKKRSPKAHPAMGAAKSRKQARDDVGELAGPSPPEYPSRSLQPRADRLMSATNEDAAAVVARSCA